jgi:hypothetical protein
MVFVQGRVLTVRYSSAKIVNGPVNAGVRWNARQLIRPCHHGRVLRSGGRAFFQRKLQTCQASSGDSKDSQDTNGITLSDASPSAPGHEGPSTDLSVIWDRLVKVMRFLQRLNMP